jgi:hypothetical protein
LIFAFNKTFSDAEVMNLRENDSTLELFKLLIQGHEHTTVRGLFENSGALTQRMACAGTQEFLTAAT